MSGQAENMTTLLTAWEWDLPSADTRWMSVKCGHHDDGHASARVHMDEGAYTCLACGLKAGSPIRLVMAVNGCDARTAINYLRSLSIDPMAGESMEVARSGPKRPWKGRRRGGAVTSNWRRAHSARTV